MRQQCWRLAGIVAAIVLTGPVDAQSRGYRQGMPARTGPGKPATAPAPAPAPAPAAAPVESPPPAPADNSPSARPYRRNYFYNNNYPRPPIIAGMNPRVIVQFPPRFDWTFAQPLENPSTFSIGSTYHDSFQTTYQLWVPTTYRHAMPHALVLWVSAKPMPDEQLAWDLVCRRHGVLFAAVYNGGNAVPPGQRMRLTLDVLDDLRRRMNVDTDRIYVGGLSEGGRTACDLAYAYPEFIGGVIAVGGASPLRQEPWLRDRVRDRLSVALVCGEIDPARREMEVLRVPSLQECAIRHRLWKLPMLGQTVPPAPVLEEIFLWLDATRLARRSLGVRYPPTRMAEGAVPVPDLWAQGVVEEAKVRLKDAKSRDDGLMQLEGVIRRWKDSPAAAQAEKLLREHNDRDKVTWQSIYEKRQLQFLYREATCLDDYLAGPLPLRDQMRKRDLLQAAVLLWEAVEKHGGDRKEGRQATRRLEELRKLVQVRG